MYKKILQHPNPILRKKSVEVKKNFDNLYGLIEDLKNTAKKHSKNDIILVGLSAPQIGLNLRVFVFYDQRLNKYIEVINPKIISLSTETSLEWEGCASIGVGKNGLVGPVKRSRYCEIEFFDANWQRKMLSASNILSHILLHEIDHLDGILFLDRVVNEKYLMTFRELDQYMKKNNGKFPKIE